MGNVKKKRRERRQFSAEYKAEVVELVRSSGKSIAQLAQELDLTETSVRSWVQQAEAAAAAPGTALLAEERAEIARLRRELRKVTMERDILKKATAFFAKGGQ